MKTICKSNSYGMALNKGRVWSKKNKNARFAIEQRGKIWHTIAL